MRRLALGTLALALALAGCGGGGHKSGGGKAVSGDAIAAAAVKTSSAGSVQADFKIGGSGITGNGSGVFNTGESRSGRLSMKVKTAVGEVKIDSIISGNVLYMRSPIFSQVGRLPAGKEWVRLDLGQLAQQRGIDLSSLANTTPTPTSALAYLRGASQVKNVGSDTVGGVSTTHYKVTVDLERAAARLSGSGRRSLHRVIQTTGMKKLPVDVWIDGDGYVRKVEYSQSSGNGKAVKVTMELHDFGSPVQVKAPPADSVIDFQKALSG